MKFRPLVQSGRVFEEQESVTLWVSDDKNRLPVRLQADILVGSIKADLENFKNLKGIANAKSEIMNNLKDNGTIILNRDDKYYNYLEKKDKLGNRAVMIASVNGHWNIVHLLCERGAIGAPLNNVKDTPWLAATAKGDIATMSELIFKDSAERNYDLSTEGGINFAMKLYVCFICLKYRKP